MEVDEKVEKSFLPIANKNSKILILGSLPSVKSLGANQYYANPQNKFWRIVFDVFNETPTENYDKKIEIILKNKLALWDVVNRANRIGSSDSAIKNVIPNDIPRFLKKYPNIKFLIFNGAFAFTSFKKHFGEPSLPYRKLLSTSPACAGRDEEKFEMWKSALTEFSSDK